MTDFLGPAFPFTEMHTHGQPFTQWKGMTLRDYFAAKAMQAFLSNPKTDEDLGIAEASFKVADAMLKWREK